METGINKQFFSDFLCSKISFTWSWDKRRSREVD